MGKRENIKRNVVFQDYYARLKNIALSVFKWEGLPETCNARFLEECLYRYGQAIFIEDADMSYLNLKVTPACDLNVYEEPVAFTAFSVGYTKIYNADDCVWIRNNYERKATENSILLFAERLTNIEMSWSVNVNAQKTPILVRTDDKTKLSLERIYEQYEGDKPVIFGAKALSEKPLEVLTTGAPYVADKLREEKRAVWNEALEFLGINTNPADKKKERLIVSEVDSNNEQIDIQVATMLLCRQQACEAINKKYGLNVSVSMRVEEFRDLYDYNVHLHGNVPDQIVSEEVGNG